MALEGLRNVLLVAVFATLPLVVLAALGVYSASLYSNPVLYFGSAVIQAYAALVAIPFTIWVIYMQSKYGSIVLRLFAEKVTYPFLLLAFVTSVSGLMIALSETRYAGAAFASELLLAVLLVIPVSRYVNSLMQFSVEDVVETLRRNSSSRAQFIASALHVLRLYILEAQHDEETIVSVMRRINDALSRIDQVEANPEVWYRFRDLLRSILVETSYLPPIPLMGRMLTSIMSWLVRNRRERVARLFIRYYRRLAQRYVEERPAYTSSKYIMFKPTILLLRSMRASETLQAYALDQVSTYISRLASMTRHGEIPASEMCRILDEARDIARPMPELAEKHTLLELVDKLWSEFGCSMRVPRTRRRKRRSPAAEKREKEGRDGEER